MKRNELLTQVKNTSSFTDFYALKAEIIEALEGKGGKADGRR